LFYRLSVFPILVPPLRERSEDIAPLAQHFLARTCAELGREPMRLSQSQAEGLKQQRWPGNIRELKNVIERAVILSKYNRARLDLAMPQASANPQVVTGGSGAIGAEAIHTDLPNEGAGHSQGETIMSTMQDATPGSTDREVSKVIAGVAVTDGAGVELTRVIGSPQLNMLDPFLLLDRFSSDKPDDYIAGFPPHPHRGFETVTYLLQGRMRHKDNAGHEGVIEAGGVQWMTAGRGVIHSEMPEQEEGLLAGFQLWINLPAANKMVPAAYQEYGRDRIPVESRDGGVEVRVVAGTTSQGTRGPVNQPLTDPLYLDASVPSGAVFTEALPEGHNAFVFVIEGRGMIGEQVLEREQLAVLTHGGVVTVAVDDEAARFLLVAGRPLQEPVARGGPFVMNTRDEIQQAFADYKRGAFA